MERGAHHVRIEVARAVRRRALEDDAVESVDRVAALHQVLPADAEVDGLQSRNGQPPPLQVEVVEEDLVREVVGALLARRVERRIFAELVRDARVEAERPRSFRTGPPLPA